MSESHLTNVPVEAFWASETFALGYHAIGKPDSKNSSLDFAFPKKLTFVLTDLILSPATEFTNGNQCTVCEITQIIENPYEKKLRFVNKVGRDTGAWTFHFTTGLRFDAIGAKSDRFFLRITNDGLLATFQLMGYFVKPKITDAIKEISKGVDGIEVGKELAGIKSSIPDGKDKNKSKKLFRARSLNRAT